MPGRSTVTRCRCGVPSCSMIAMPTTLLGNWHPDVHWAQPEQEHRSSSGDIVTPHFEQTHRVGAEGILGLDARSLRCMLACGWSFGWSFTTCAPGSARFMKSTSVLVGRESGSCILEFSASTQLEQFHTLADLVFFLTIPRCTILTYSSPIVGSWHAWCHHRSQPSHCNENPV